MKFSVYSFTNTGFLGFLWHTDYTVNFQMSLVYLSFQSKALALNAFQMENTSIHIHSISKLKDYNKDLKALW